MCSDFDTSIIPKFCRFFYFCCVEILYSTSHHTKLKFFLSEFVRASHAGQQLTKVNNILHNHSFSLLIGSDSPAKRGPATPPPPPSRGVPQIHNTYTGEQPGTSSEEVPQGVAKCSRNLFGPSSLQGSPLDTPSSSSPNASPRGLQGFPKTYAAATQMR